MPAPKGNRFAAKENPKIKRFQAFFRPEAHEILKNIANSEKTSMMQILEKALLNTYPKEFDNLF